MILVVANSRQMRGNLHISADDSRSVAKCKDIHEQADRTGFTPSGLVKDGQQWTSSGLDDVLKVC